MTGRVLAFDTSTLSGGAGYTSSSNVATTTTGSGNGLTVDTTASAITSGIASTISRTANGSGYTTGTTGAATTATSGNGSGLTLDLTASVLTSGIASTITLDTSGTGYSNATGVATTATSGSGSGLIVNIAANPNGNITAANIIQGGSGYAVNDTASIDGGGGTGGIIRIDSVTSIGGVISSVLVNQDGTGYTAGDTITISGGTTSATINILSIKNSICFIAGTNISTDQGNIAIEKIIPGEHTINNKRITHITQTYLSDDKLVLIKKDAISKNLPSEDTIMSGFHKIKYNNHIYEAYKLVGLFKKAKFIKYKGQELYNVLMDEHQYMQVNNMTVETLNPNNIIARLHKANIPSNEMENIIKEINKATEKEDIESVKEISKSINSYLK